MTMRIFYVVVAAALLLASGCLGVETVDCPGGGLCPAGLVCRLDRGVQTCVAASCGNGVLEAGESCDDGNNDSRDSCPGDCISVERCGNGSVDPGEDCDDGNRVSGDGCQDTCRFPIRPPGRYDHAMAYDRARSTLVVFGGFGFGPVRLGDTWEWDGTDWMERAPLDPSPSPRNGAAMTYDSVRQRVMLFGGMDPMGQPMNDLWEWDGQTWHEIVDSMAPSPREGVAMTFDPVRGVIVLFGGRVRSTDLITDETWEWNGTWRLITPTSGSPDARESASMVYDASRAQSLLVGGRLDGITWVWNGARWMNIGLQTPPYFYDARMAYDPMRQRTVRYGGSIPPEPNSFGGTWELGTMWNEVFSSSGPTRRYSSDMAYVDSLGEIVLFGGYAQDENEISNDLWSWNGSRWKEHL